MDGVSSGNVLVCIVTFAYLGISSKAEFCIACATIKHDRGLIQVAHQDLLMDLAH